MMRLFERESMSQVTEAAGEQTAVAWRLIRPLSATEQPSTHSTAIGSITSPEKKMSSNRDSRSTQHTTALLRHFADLRDGTHGGATSRQDKERVFAAEVTLLDPHVQHALEGINADLLLATGEVTFTGVRRSTDGGVEAVWALSWPEQQRAGVKPVVVRAYYGGGFHHPHLQSGTVGDWPLNVFDDEQAAAEVPTLHAMASADLHNLVFKLGGDWRVVPAVGA
jgi:hypothetical protein